MWGQMRHAVAKKRQKMYALYPSDGNNMLTIRDCFFYFYVMIPHDRGGDAFALGCKTTESSNALKNNTTTVHVFFLFSAP